MFSDKYLKIEKEKFFDNLNKEELNSLDLHQLIFEIFKDKTLAEVELVDLTFDKHRDYKVNYKFYKSLNTFLSRSNISKDFTSRSDQNEVYEHRRENFTPFKLECEHFISTVTKKHNITTLSDENLAHIRRKFKKDSRKRYLNIYSAQLIALLIAIPLGIIVYGLATHRLSIDNNWRFHWGYSVPQLTNSPSGMNSVYSPSVSSYNNSSSASNISRPQNSNNTNTSVVDTSGNNTTESVNNSKTDITKENPEQIVTKQENVEQITNNPIDNNNPSLNDPNANISRNNYSPKPKNVTSSENSTNNASSGAFKDDGRGNKYKGEYDNSGRKNGQGIYITANGNRYEGIFRNGSFFSGNANETDGYGNKYTGQYDNYNRNGNGILIRSNGSRYEGVFQNGSLFSGNVNETDGYGNKYTGQYDKYNRNGNGILIKSNGSRYEGVFQNGSLFSGNVNETDGYGNKYTGQYDNYNRNGNGTLIKSNGSKYEGTFRSGNFWNGYANEIDGNGRTYSGYYQNGRRVK